MNNLFRSSRFGFCKWQPEDFAPIAAMNSDATVMEFFPSTLSPGESAVFINSMQAHFVEHGPDYNVLDRLDTGVNADPRF